ncbi:CPBP family intramembrane glutamic endopeptidase [Celeribacter litoreus]|uniref:CPBP family intramembrane glutamic endopeptidase n=1 Tax=Celeribacter litoreus TaxID=2876714 RepID=UPI001CCFFADE|nr:CPBP family intramembrane glutamic endopeptidase [Celeribacter litoreus]MCA0042280.1 CPBP family intramembrane metalloprotease [Celeribacter litoreus]
MAERVQNTHPYAPIIASAMRRPELWRVGVSLLVALGIGALLTPLFFIIVAQIAPNLNPLQFGPRGIAIGTTPGGLFTLLASFFLLLFGTVLMARRLHDRNLRELTGDSRVMRAQFLTTLKWVAAFTFLSLLLPWEAEVDMVRNLSLPLWLMWLPIALLALLIQVLAEELFFRGYLQSQIAASTGSYSLGLVASSVLFGLAHLDGAAEGMAGLFPVLWAMGFGLLSGDLTMRSGTIGPAIALHLVNNASAILLAAQLDRMSGFALYVQTSDPSALYSDPLVIIMQSLLLFVSWLVARLAIRR